MFYVHVCLLYIWFVCIVCVPSVLWYCWLGLFTCKNRLPYNLYCVGRDVKHCSIQSICSDVVTFLDSSSLKVYSKHICLFVSSPSDIFLCNLRCRHDINVMFLGFVRFSIHVFIVLFGCDEGQAFRVFVLQRKYLGYFRVGLISSLVFCLVFLLLLLLFSQQCYVNTWQDVNLGQPCAQQGISTSYTID